jgi:tetratricopeptide (TPR) repeat protein
MESAMPRRRTPWDLNEMGLYFYGREAYDLAIGEFKRALAGMLFQTPVIHVNLGAAYLGKKMYAEARASLLTALKLEPNNQQAHWLLAQAFQAIGLLAETHAELERTQAINPDSPEGRRAREALRAHPRPLVRSAEEGRR